MKIFKGHNDDVMRVDFQQMLDFVGFKWYKGKNFLENEVKTANLIGCDRHLNVKLLCKLDGKLIKRERMLILNDFLVKIFVKVEKILKDNLERLHFDFGNNFRI